MEKLLLDEMLKRAATWCRILGVDAEFFTGGGDELLLAQARESGRTLVTRDLELSKRCAKEGIPFILLESEKVEEQIAQILRDAGLRMSFPEEMRCPACNGELESAPPEAVKEEVPPHVSASQQKFWRCLKCRKIYWQGSHWINIRLFYERVARLLEKGKNKAEGAKL